MKCMCCRGEMVRGTAPFHIDRNGVHVRLDQDPAWVCTQCGESYFEDTEVDALQEIVRAVDAHAEKIARVG